MAIKLFKTRNNSEKKKKNETFALKREIPSTYPEFIYADELSNG